MKLYLSSFRDPYRNLALEQDLYQRGEEAVYLWINDPCVVIGRHQNPYRETDLSCLAGRGISLVRRLSGGGAVYHDPGNLNYTWISRDSDPAGILTLIQSVLSSVGIHAVPGGRNDLMVGNQKVGGMASQQDLVCLHHGTLMVKVDLDAMNRALRPSPLKLRTKGIQSARARVANLSEFTPDLTVQQLIEAFRETLGTKEIPPVVTPDVLALEEALQSPDWLYDESPDYDLFLERLLNGSIYQFELKIVRGRISDIAIHTDALDPLDLSPLKLQLQGIPFNELTFDRLLNQSRINE